MKKTHFIWLLLFILIITGCSRDKGPIEFKVKLVKNQLESGGFEFSAIVPKDVIGELRYDWDFGDNTPNSS